LANRIIAVIGPLHKMAAKNVYKVESN